MIGVTSATILLGYPIAKASLRISDGDKLHTLEISIDTGVVLAHATNTDHSCS
jgi:hypothetical protein